MTTSPQHLEYMGCALKLARQGLGRTSPNPAVGAVVVTEGQIAGEGYHSGPGQPHAEVEALREASTGTGGADLYVILEPCSTWGRTPPCTDAIIAAKIRRVIYACDDCDPRNAGRAAGVLQAAGIETLCGPLGEEARELNEGYFMHKTTGRPFVTVKLACSLDGKIATRRGDSRRMTGEAARQWVHELRDRSDAVMVGVGTVLADDPALTTRLDSAACRDPVRVIVDTSARTPPGARVITGPSSAPCLIAATKRSSEEYLVVLREAGAEVLLVPERAGRVDLAALITHLGQRDITTVLVEGGAHLVGGLLRQNLVDKLLFFYAPKIIGDEQALSAIVGGDIGEMSEARKVEIRRVEQIGDDILVTAYPCSQD